MLKLRRLLKRKKEIQKKKIVMRCNMIKGEFLKQLARRVSIDISPGPEQLEFSLYVRLMREKLNIDRNRLAERTGFERDFLTFLENQLLTPDEVTPEVRRKVENALGISFQSFKLRNQVILDKLRPDWEKSRFLVEEETSKRI